MGDDSKPTISDPQKWVGLSYIDLTGVPPGEREFLSALVQPTSLPLPGDKGHLWVTPVKSQKSPECEFGEATAILKTLKLNPNVPAFELSSTSMGAPPPSTSNFSSKPLNAASAPFVPHNMPMPTQPPPQTIMINNMTANLNYHMIPDPTKLPTSSGAYSNMAAAVSQAAGAIPHTNVEAGHQQQQQHPHHHQQPPPSHPTVQTLANPFIASANGSFPTAGPAIQSYRPPFPTQTHNPPVYLHHHHHIPGSDPNGVGYQQTMYMYPAQPHQLHHTHMPHTTVTDNNAAVAGAPVNYYQPGNPSTVASTPSSTVPFAIQPQPHMIVKQQQLSANNIPYYHSTSSHANNSQSLSGSTSAEPYGSNSSSNSGITFGSTPPIVSVKGKLHNDEDDLPASSSTPTFSSRQSAPPPPSTIQRIGSVDVGNTQYTQPSHNQQHQQGTYQHHQQHPDSIQKGTEATRYNSHNRQDVPEQTMPSPADYSQASGVKPQPTQGVATAVQNQNNKQQQHQNYPPMGLVSCHSGPPNHQAPFQLEKPAVAVVASPPTEAVPVEQFTSDWKQPAQSLPQQQVVQQSMGKPSAVDDATAGQDIVNGDANNELQIELEADSPDSKQLASPPSGPESSAGTVVQVAAAETVDRPPAESVPGVTSWASLFSKSSDHSGNSIGVKNDKPCARIPPFTTIDGDSETGSGDSVVGSAYNGGASRAAGGLDGPLASGGAALEDPQYLGLARFLAGYSLSHYSPALLPRGLTNRSNWCFVNAILQALLACPPFYNLMKSLPTIGGLKARKSLTPITDSLVEFVHEFSALESLATKAQKKDKKMKKEEIRTGICLEPSYVYKMLLNMSSDTFKVVEGRQEDAEEFLTCILNGVSDEMLALLKCHRRSEEAAESAAGTAGQVEEEGGEERDEEWEEVGAKGKSCITRRVTEQASAPVTPVQSMALGMCRSCVRSATGDTSATLQPFFTLQLDIQSEGVASLNQALVTNFDSETLDGYICSKTKQVVEATRSLSLEELPPVLILHMKRFVYDAKTGGVEKVMKAVSFSVDLEIPKSVLSGEARSKLSQKQRQYKLFAVVYHNGREATKGHYVTDVYHTGFSAWLHCDDSQVQETGEQSVLTPSPTSTPYILFYRRCDTMVGHDKSSSNVAGPTQANQAADKIFRQN